MVILQVKRRRYDVLMMLHQTVRIHTPHLLTFSHNCSWCGSPQLAALSTEEDTVGIAVGSVKRHRNILAVSVPSELHERRQTKP